MGYAAKVICDSIAPNGRRATTMLVTMPQMIEQEFLRHRSFSCSFSSTRAIPMIKQIQAVIDDPMIPVSWGKVGKGMQAKEELSKSDSYKAREYWLSASRRAIDFTKLLVRDLDTNSTLENAVHKQVAGRLLQPFAWRTGVITATDWRQFFTLRCHADAQPEIQPFAYLCLKAYLESISRQLDECQWHRPFVDFQPLLGFAEDSLNKISAARCARTSYLKHPSTEEYKESDLIPNAEEDIAMANRLLDGSGGVGHFSPFEHQLQARGKAEGFIASGNMLGFIQFRKTLSGENSEELVTDNKLRDLLNNVPFDLSKYI